MTDKGRTGFGDALLVVGAVPNIERILKGIAAILDADATSETKIKALEAVARLGSIEHAVIKDNTIGDTHNHYHAVAEQPENEHSPWHTEPAERHKG